MTTIPEPMRRRAYGMRGDSVSAPLHHHFVVQCRLMSGIWARLLASEYAECTVCARSAAPDGLPLAGEDNTEDGPKLRNMWQHRSSPLGEAEPGAIGHVAALEPASTGR
jgi:hypothetical protein